MREVELDAGKAVVELLEQFRGELFLVASAGPLTDGLERREEFRVEETGGVGAVVGTAVLRHDGFDLGPGADHLAHLVDVAVAFLKRDGRRQRGANPEIALFQLRQEFEAEQTAERDRHQHEADRAAEHDVAIGDRPSQQRRVQPVQDQHHLRLGFLDMRGQDDRGQCGRDGERRKEPTGERIGIGAGHRPEDVALDPGQREQRQEGRNDDRRGEEDRTRDVGGRAEDSVALHAEQRLVGHMLGFRDRRRLRQAAEDRLHHDDGGIDDQAEIDRADRQQVRRFPAQHQDDDGEEQRERNGGADDQRAAQIAEEDPLQQHDQQYADHHVVQHGVGGELDQVAAIVDALDAHAGRQNAGIVDGLNELVDALDGRRALLAAPHQDDALHDVVGLVEPGNAEARLLADGDGRDVLDQHRIAARLRHHGVGEIVDRPDQADAAHDGRLLANIDGVAADIDVGVADRLEQLRQRQTVGDELAEVDLDLIGLALATPPGDVDDPRHRAEAALENPVLNGLEVEHAVVRRADQTVAEDLADRAERRDLRLHVARQRRELRQAVQHLLQRLVIGVGEGELNFDVGQTVERDGADGRDVLQARDLGLDRDRDVALDLLRRQSRALRHDVDHRRGRIGVGLDVELVERDQSADQHGGEHADHQEPPVDGKGNETIHSGLQFLGVVDQLPDAARSMNRLPLVTICSPGFRLLVTSTRLPLMRPILIWRSSTDLSSRATQMRTLSAS